MVDIMKKKYRKNIGDVLLEFSINGKAKHDEWVDVDIKLKSPVICYNLRDWEENGEIIEIIDIEDIISLMERWEKGELANIEEYETLEPDLLLKFYPNEKRIDFCVCLQTKRFAFTNNYIVISLRGKNAIDFVDYWKSVDICKKYIH